MVNGMKKSIPSQAARDILQPHCGRHCEERVFERRSNLITPKALFYRVSLCLIAFVALSHTVHAQPAEPAVNAPNAAATPLLQIDQFTLSSPLVTATRPFDVVLIVKNTGTGDYPGGDTVRLEAAEPTALATLGEHATEELKLGPLRPGEHQSLRWRDLVAQSKSDWTLTCTLQSVESRQSFHVFDAEPETRSEHSDSPALPIFFANPVAAEASNAWSRLSLVMENRGDAYAIAETWDGAKWRRVGSLYPLVRVVIRHGEERAPEDGVRQELAVAFESMEAENGVLSIHGRARTPDGQTWPVHVAFRPEAGAPRIGMRAVFGGPREVEVLAFSGPTVLAGDRAFGAVKQFALFPGIEYLEGEETSSSERDLAYPLNERSVPAAYKITVPLMAVQGRDSLVALLWEPRQEWAAGQRFPAACFLAPEVESGLDYVHLSLFAPTVGPYIPENQREASEGFKLRKLEHVALESCLVLDNKRRYPPDSIARGPHKGGPHKGGLLLQALQHWIDVVGLPEPMAPPRDWDAVRALSRQANLGVLWNEEAPGWKPTAQSQNERGLGLAVPLLADLRAGVPDDARPEIERRLTLTFEDAANKNSMKTLWSADGSLLHVGELPFYVGFLPESLADFRDYASKLCNSRTDGVWVWHPADAQQATLGIDGDHTLGQASLPSYWALRAARLTGDATLRQEALEAMAQMERYDVPRGAQAAECPLRQPDLLAAAQAVSAYCEAYRLTQDAKYLEEARYWAYTGLPFIYLWSFRDRPSMLYNSIPAFGSTLFTQSWIGRPRISCGLAYAYALQDLAEFDAASDAAFPWKQVAQGIFNSAAWQQYADGPNKGCYADSWNIPDNTPCPPGVNPEALLLNGCRLNGPAPQVRFARVGNDAENLVVLNSLADIKVVSGSVAEGAVHFELAGAATLALHTMLAPVPEPGGVSGAGERVADSEVLRQVEEGWLYSAELKAVVFKHKKEKAVCDVRW